MIKKTIAIFWFFLAAISCSDEAYQNDPSDSDNSPVSTYQPSGDNDYWIYDVANSSSSVPEMNFTASDSIYVSSANNNTLTLSANDDGMARGSMTRLITNGTLNKTATTLVLSGSIDLLDNLSDLGISEVPSIDNMILVDTNAANDSQLFNQSENTSQTLDIMGNAFPVEINSSITTSKINFYNTKSLNGSQYNNVFEGELKITVEVNGTFSLGGFTQTVPVLMPQDVISMTYFFAENIGLVRAESSQGFSISSQLITVLTLANIPVDFPTTISTETVEELNTYFTE